MKTIFMPFCLRWFIPVSFFICLLLSSCKSSTCSKTVSCPAYASTAIDVWFPYHDKQQLIFKNAANQYDTLFLNITDSTVAQTYTTGYGSPPNQGCSALKTLTSL